MRELRSLDVRKDLFIGNAFKLTKTVDYLSLSTGMTIIILLSPTSLCVQHHHHGTHYIVLTLSHQKINTGTCLSHGHTLYLFIAPQHKLEILP